MDPGTSEARRGHSHRERGVSTDVCARLGARRPCDIRSAATKTGPNRAPTPRGVREIRQQGAPSTRAKYSNTDARSMITTRLTVNGATRDVSAAPDTPLLYVLRNELGLTGPKFGCGLGQCGACMVHIDG